MKQSNLQRLEKLQPEQVRGIWLVESIPGSEQVRVTNCNQGIRKEVWSRKRARETTDGQVCLWVNLYDGYVPESDR